MDSTDIEEFINYTITPDADPQFLVDKIKKSALAYLPLKQIDEIQRAYEFTRVAHGHEVRLSGEPYIVHPVKATLFLMDLKPDLPTIQACLLHDVIEDTTVRYDELRQEFGQQVADLCEGLVKVAKVRYQGEDRQIETLKKTFLAMGKDIRVIFIKLVDRIHNIQTLSFHPKEEKRKRIAEETLKIYVPIAKRLGLYRYQVLLETGALKELRPKDFVFILDYLKKLYGESTTIKRKGILILRDILDKEHIPYIDIKGRLKSIYRIYQKLEDKYKTKDLSKVMDILAFRIVTDTISDCYNILGVIHSHFTPMINKIKDYIALPKANGYKSIHTTVLGMFSFPVEIQIRTKEMDDIAEFGVVAHFAYSEEKRTLGGASVPESHTQWIKRLQDIVKEYTGSTDKEGFKTTLDIELLNQKIFVYTPKGEVIELPAGSTVLDFAFKIHTDLGLKYKHAFINGSIVPINRPLKTGDIVSIAVHKNKYTASKFWDDFLHMPSAKSKLALFINQQEKNHQIHKTQSKKKKIIPSHSVEKHISSLSPSSQKNQGEFPKRLIIDDIHDLPVVLCGECDPHYPQRVVAKSSKEGLKIHSLTCKALHVLHYDKLVEAHWTGQERTDYLVELHILLHHQQSVLLEILQVFAPFRIDVENLEFHKHAGDDDLLKVRFHSSLPSKIHFVMKSLKNIHGFVRLVKKTIS